MNTQPLSQLIQYILLIFQPLARNNSQYLYNYNHNFFPLISGSHEDIWSSGFPNYDKLLQLWQDRSKKYRKVVTRANNDNHDQSRRCSVSCSYPWVAAHCCIWICCSLLQLPLYSLRGIVSFDHIIWATMEWMVIISAMNVHPSLGMFILLHLYPYILNYLYKITICYHNPRY